MPVNTIREVRICDTRTTKDEEITKDTNNSELKKDNNKLNNKLKNELNNKLIKTELQEWLDFEEDTCFIEKDDKKKDGKKNPQTTR